MGLWCVCGVVRCACVCGDGVSKSVSKFECAGGLIPHGVE